jgi:predicted ATP-grasp superfamily ATP-dependent carboligase
MRVFVYEYTCGGTGGGAALHAEGWAMLTAVVEDLTRRPGVSTATLLDAGLLSAARARWGAGVHIATATADTEESIFRSLAAAADWTLVVAPESDGILAQRCHWVRQAGGRLLGPSAEALAQTADKLEFSRRLGRVRGVPTPPTVPFHLPFAVPWPFPWVCKPRDGAGSQATFVIHNEEELRHSIDQARAEGWQGELIVQPFVPGRAASVACLLGPAQRVILPACKQRLSGEGRLRYLGGSLPLEAGLNDRARHLAAEVVRAIPGVFGFTGIDLVLGDAEDGSQDAVIEINPRLTTSYVGLRRLARFNLAEAMLALAQGGPLPAMTWGMNRIAFRADGVAEEE